PVAAHERIVVGVGDLGLVELEIEPVVVRDLAGEARKFAFGGLAAQLLDRGLLGRPLRGPLHRRCPAAMSRSAAARASSVTTAPDSMRATSSRRSSSSSTSMRVTTAPWAAPLAATLDTRQW